MKDLEKVGNIFDIAITQGNMSPIQLRQLQNELNNFFEDLCCDNIIFTDNKDKIFFGMVVYPDVHPNDVYAILNNKEQATTTHYVIELDSRLFDGTFTGRELVAMLIHEVGHVNSEHAKKQIRNQFNANIVKMHSNFSIKDFSKCPDLLVFMYKRTLRMVTSIFNKDADEFEADRFCVEYGYGPELESAFAKMLKMRGSMAPIQDKFINIKWYLVTYNQLTRRRKAVNKLMEDNKEFTGSKLDKQEFDKVTNKLREVNVCTESVIHEAFSKKIIDITESSGFMSKIKRNGMKAIEDEVYLYTIKVKNIESENEAMDIMIDLNSKLNIVNDYINTEKLSDSEFKRWDLLRIKLTQLREEVVKKPAYRQKYYGLFVEYPMTSRGY